MVVAAAGGGIQAAAWTAKVLTELHARYGQDFTRSVRLVSGVSGGSVGLMYYLDRYEQLREARTPEETAAVLHAINQQARASSLEASAWGVAFYDLAPTFLPVRRLWPGLLRDRGTVLEDLWSTRLAHRDPATFTLRGLQQDIRRRGYPIPVFNSTNGSTGAAVLMVPHTPDRARHGPGLRSRRVGPGLSRLGSERRLRDPAVGHVLLCLADLPPGIW